MAPWGFTVGHSHKHWPIMLWQEAVEAAELIQHDSSCQYMIKYSATLLKNLTHPTFSLNQSCPAGVLQKERQGRVLIKERGGISSKDSPWKDGKRSSGNTKTRHLRDSLAKLTC